MTTVDLDRRLVAWRHHLHRHPEIGFAEHATAAYVAAELEAMGLVVHRGIGGTGLVADIACRAPGRTVGLRADMDALAIAEDGHDRPHASLAPGTMHACGHDGHMAMLLGAAASLLADPPAAGTVRLVFQPAEEHGRGAAAMLADGLLERFPMEQIYGLHNMPGLPAGTIATRAGGIMASEDDFEIRITGRGGHAARPHLTIDPLVVGAELVLALQTVVARSVDPAELAVLSCTEFVTDGIRNALPTHVTIRGDARSYTPGVQALIERRLREITAGVCSAHGATCEVDYLHEFAPTVNDAACVDLAVDAARAVVGAENVDGDTPPILASEDFGAFLRVIPGAFVFVGNGETGTPGGVPLHNARYDTDDAILGVGARWLAEVARRSLAR